MRFTLLPPAALLAVLLLLPAPACGGDDDDPDALITRFFHVAGLTQGRPDFIPGIIGFVLPDMVSDEDNPLFGAEGEEPLQPLGAVDELVELIRMNVDPVSWEITEGADIRTLGEDTIVVRTARRVMPLVAAYLIRLEEEMPPSVTVEVRVANGEPPADGIVTQEVIQASTANPSVRLTSLVGQQALAYAGTQQAFVQDYDVEVATRAKISDPIVNILNLGLSVTARSLMGNDPSRIRIQLDARLGALESMRAHRTEEARVIEMPRLEEAAMHGELLLEPGVWTLASGDTTHDRYFLVRATAQRRQGKAAHTPIDFGPPAPADSGPLVTRTFDITDLEMIVPSYVGREVNLVPSNFTPPELPELAEPEPVFPAHALADLLPGLVMPKSWDRQGASIDVRMGRLMVTNTDRALAAVGEAIRDLRRVFLWTVRTRAELVELPQGLADLLASPSEEGYLLDPRRRQLLDESIAAGDARRLESLELVSLGDTRNAVHSGSTVAYLQDFEVEIAEDAAIANPVVQEVLSGAVLDLSPAMTSTGDAVMLGVRFTRGTVRTPLREVESPHGAIEAPELDILRLRTNLRVPFGRTAITGVGSVEGRARMLLLTPTLEPYGDG